jgi:hypothetical protein
MFIGHFALGFAAKQAVPRASLAVLFTAAQLADILWPVFVMIGLEQVRIEPGITAFTPLNFISYPYSHSLLMLAVWGVVFALLFGREIRLKADATTAAATTPLHTTTAAATPPVASGFPPLPKASARLADQPPPRLRRSAEASAKAEGGSRTFIVLFALVVSHWVLDFVTHRPDVPLYPGGPKLGLGLWNSVPATIAVEVSMFAIGLWMYGRATWARDQRGRWALAGLAAFLVVVYIANIVGPPPPTVQTLAISAFIGFVVLVVWSWWADRHREAILRTR